MSGFSLAFKVHGDKQIAKHLRAIGPKRARPIVRAAVRSVTSTLRKEMKKEAPRDTGQLRKSLIATVRTYKKGTVFGVVGVDRNAKNPETGRNPRKYLHLVTLGTARSAANDFVAKTAKRTAERARDLMAQRIRDGIVRDAAKAVKR